MEIIHLDVVDSTNDYLQRNYKQLNNNTCVYANLQTKGKGRRGHIWRAQVSKNLTASFLIKDIKDIQDAWKYTVIASLAIKETLKHYQIYSLIKWPNDIYVLDDKISGILTETILDPDLKGIIIGIGLNVNEASPYTCMKNYSHHEYSIEEVLHVLIEKLEKYLSLDFKTCLEEVNACSYLKGKKVYLPLYGYVEFTKLNEAGQIEFIDESNNTHSKTLNEITLSRT